MQNTFLLLTIGLIAFWFGRFVLGLLKGRVRGAHPIEKKLAWIEKTEHPKHFWLFTLFQCLLFVIVTLIILMFRNKPVY